MPYVEVAVLMPWSGFGPPAFINEIHSWAEANEEWLSTWRDARGVIGHSTFKCIDKTGVRGGLWIGRATVYAALLTVTAATAQHFQSDPRMFRLGWKVFDDSGELQSSNWGKTLDAASRTQALDWLEAHGYTRTQVAARFDATDTRKQILDKLRVMFREVPEE